MRSKQKGSGTSGGARFPDYELPDHIRVKRSLSRLRGRDPMVLIRSRGHFCPGGHQQHLEYAANHPKFAIAYAKTVTVSTSCPTASTW